MSNKKVCDICGEEDSGGEELLWGEYRNLGPCAVAEAWLSDIDLCPSCNNDVKSFLRHNREAAEAEKIDPKVREARVASR